MKTTGLKWADLVNGPTWLMGRVNGQYSGQVFCDGTTRSSAHEEQRSRDSLLPWSSFPGGDDWASGGAIRHAFAQPFAGEEHPPGMPAAPFSFLLLCEAEHPKP